MQRDSEKHPSKLFSSGSVSGGGIPKPLKPRSVQHPLAADITTLSPAKKTNKEDATGRRDGTITSSSSSTPATSTSLPVRSTNLAPLSSGNTPIVAKPIQPKQPSSSPSAASANSVSTPISTRPPPPIKPSSSSSSSSSSVNPASTSSASSSTAAPTSSSSSATPLPLADKVLKHWRSFTSARVEEYSLDQRSLSFRLSHVIHAWSAYSKQHKREWQNRIKRSTAVRYLQLKNGFARWKLKSLGPERPSARRDALQFLLNKAQAFQQFQRRRHAVRKWKLVTEVKKRLNHASQVLITQLNQQRQTEAWRLWRHRMAHLRTLEKLRAVFATELSHRHLKQWMTHWKNARESSVLERLQSGIARKHAYRSTIKQYFRYWKQFIARQDALQRKAVQAVVQRSKSHRLAYLRVWSQVAQRQLQFRAVVEKRLAIRAEEATRSALNRWIARVKDLRHEDMLSRLSIRLNRSLRLRSALRKWQLFQLQQQVRRIMGQTAFSRMGRFWKRWRKALALSRVQHRLQLQAKHHWEYQALTSALQRWRQSAKRNQKVHLARQKAIALARKQLLRRTMHSWSTNARELRKAQVMQQDSLSFRRSHLLALGLAQLKGRVAQARKHAQLHRLEYAFKRTSAFDAWRNFTDQSLLSHRNGLKAKRFRFFALLKGTFRAWRQTAKADRANQLSLLLNRGAPILFRLKSSLFHLWQIRAAQQKKERKKEDIAVHFDCDRMRTSYFSAWRILFQTRRNERLKVELSIQHARVRLLTGALLPWRRLARANRDQRRRVQDGLQWVSFRMEQVTLARFMQQWRTQLHLNQLQSRRIQQAVLHRARVVLFHAYTSWQTRMQQAQQRKAFLQSCAERIQVICTRRFYGLWQQQLKIRRYKLSRHLLSIQFWSRRVQRLAWKGWIQFHRRKQQKKALLEQAAQFHRDQMRKRGLALFVQNGMELFETGLAIASRPSLHQLADGRVAHNPFHSIASHRAVLKCALVWKEKTRRRRRDDETRGFNRRITNLVPLAFAPLSVSGIRPPPLPLPDAALLPLLQPMPLQLRLDAPSSNVPAPVFAKSELASVPDAAALFPSLAKNRPPPRRPIDLMIEFPIQLPIQPITAAYANRHAVDPLLNIPAPASILSSPAIPIEASYQQLFPTAFGQSEIPLASDNAMELSALEQHLERLVAWKGDCKMRKNRLQQLEQAASFTPTPSAELLVALEQARRLVTADQEHRPYYEEQVKEVQSKLADMMEAEEAAAGAAVY